MEKNSNDNRSDGNLTSVFNASKKHGISDDVIRYYLRMLKIEPAVQGRGGRRSPALYRQDDIDRAIKRSRQTRFDENGKYCNTLT